MPRFGNRMRLFCVVAASGVLMAGCPNVGDLRYPNTLNSFLSQSGILDTLNQQQANDGSTGQTAAELKVSSSDEQPFFGEHADDFSGAGGESHVSAASLLSDVNTDGSANDSAPHGTFSGTLSSGKAQSSEAKADGVMRGVWNDTDGNQVGVLEGRYRAFDSAHLPEGFISGGVFAAKVVDMDGHCMGVLEGRFGVSGDGSGAFVGRWFDHEQRMAGVVRGDWTPGADGADGTFTGRWAAFSVCQQADSMPMYNFADGDFGGLTDSDEPVNPGWTDENSGDVNHETDSQTGADNSCASADKRLGTVRGWHMPPMNLNDTPLARLHAVARFRALVRDNDGNVVGYLMGYARPFADGSSDSQEGGDQQGDDNAGGGSGDASDDQGTDETPAGDAGGDAGSSEPSGGDAGASGSGDAGSGSGDAGSGSGDAGAGSGDAGAGGGEPPRSPFRHGHAGKLGVFYGKFVNAEGHFQGFVRGVYGRGFHGLGVFQAQELSPDSVELGRFVGRWDSAPKRPGGPLFGVWLPPQQSSDAPAGGDAPSSDDTPAGGGDAPAGGDAGSEPEDNTPTP